MTSPSLDRDRLSLSGRCLELSPDCLPCLRDLGHTGRHMARHPSEIGEHVWWERVADDDTARESA